MKEIIEYSKQYYEEMINFLERCLPESGRALDINGRHAYYNDVENHFRQFWLLLDDYNKVIGAVGINEISCEDCELKSLYLLEEYHGQGLGYLLINKAIDYAKKSKYKRMYLDSLSTSVKAIKLYKRVGFVDTEKYNDAIRSDIFMVMDLV